MSDEQIKLFQKLWDIANILRGKMDASEFKNYILGFIFYKFLSLKLETYLNEQLQNDGVTYQEAYTDVSIREDLKEEALTTLGYFIEPEFLFSSILVLAAQKEDILATLEKALKNIEDSTLGSESADDFDGLFGDVDLTSKKLGSSEAERNRAISEVLLKLDEISFDVDSAHIDILGDAYEYLIGEFASSAGKKAGEFYTPQQVSKILASIVTLGRPNIKTVYDPCCGSGSLLLRVKKQLEQIRGKGETSDLGVHFSGQELTATTYNLGRMNMLLHGVKYSDFDIVQGDTLENPQHLEKKFDAVVANPPFSANWNADSLKLDDERFSAYGRLAPKTKADFAFVQHMIHHLSESGTMAVVLPHGVLFRGASELAIRQFLIEERNYLDAVIGLPSNLFYGTSIPTAILVFKKCRENPTDILFIDASKEFEKRKTQNFLTDTHIAKILATYENREQIEKYSYVASLEEIRENEYNLNIPRYVDTFEAEEEIDIGGVALELKVLDVSEKSIDEKILKFCKELGIEMP